MNLQNKIIQLENKIKPKAPGIIICHCRDAANQKIERYYKDYGYSNQPFVMIAAKIKKPSNSGLGE